MDEHYSTEAPAEYADYSIRDLIAHCDEMEREERMAQLERGGRA